MGVNHKAVMAAIVCAGLGLLAGGAGAEEFAPRITGELAIEVQNDWTYESDDEDSELNDLFTTTELDLNAFATEHLYLNAHLTLEPVLDPDPRDDRFFEDHGLFAEALNLNYETDAFHIFGGKFGPNFSIVYDAAPGIYGTDIAEDDIELSERIGFGGSVTFGDDGLAFQDAGIGRHSVSTSVFFADTSLLTESLFTGRGNVDEDDGGPSNTGTPESFTLALDGEEIPQLPGMRYHLGFARQAVDRVLDDDGAAVGDIADEYRVVAAVEWGVEITEDLSITPLLEYVHFWNAGGLGSQDRDYVTASTLFEYQNWNLALAYTGRFIDDDAGEDFDDFQVQVSAGYTFDFGLSADIGWKFSEEENVETQIFGTFLAYSLEF